MNDDTIQIIALAVATVAQVYMTRPDWAPFAAFWNFIAMFFGGLANMFGHWALVARLNYLEAVNNGA